jgi:hypothetical protein
MSQGDRAIIRDALACSDATRIIVTHGTGTMVDTARALMDIPGKTIVLTGALQPGRFAISLMNNPCKYHFVKCTRTVTTLSWLIYV